MKTIISATLGEAWIKSMTEIIDFGSVISDDGEMLKEVCDLFVLIHSLDEDDGILQKYADQKRIALMKEKYATCGLVGDYDIDYGSYIYDDGSKHVDQVERVKNKIVRKRDSKSATIKLHKPDDEKLPCLTSLDFRLREGKINMTVNYRSQNVFASQPGNLLALRNIQRDIANSLSVDLGVVHLLVVSAHIYEKDIQIATNILSNFR